MTPGPVNRWTLTWPQVAAKGPDDRMTLSDTTGHEHQHTLTEAEPRPQTWSWLKLGPYDALTLGDITCHSGLYGPSSSTGRTQILILSVLIFL